MKTRDALLMYWLYIFNEQMHDQSEDWSELDQSDAPRDALFRHWLKEWSDDTRGTLLELLEGGKA